MLRFDAQSIHYTYVCMYVYIYIYIYIHIYMNTYKYIYRERDEHVVEFHSYGLIY